MTNNNFNKLKNIKNNENIQIFQFHIHSNNLKLNRLNTGDTYKSNG